MRLFVLVLVLTISTGVLASKPVFILPANSPFIEVDSGHPEISRFEGVSELEGQLKIRWLFYGDPSFKEDEIEITFIPNEASQSLLPNAEDEAPPRLLIIKQSSSTLESIVNGELLDNLKKQSIIEVVGEAVITIHELWSAVDCNARSYVVSLIEVNKFEQKAPKPL